MVEPVAQPGQPKRMLQCPCGVLLEASDDDELVALAKQHLAETHPGLEYSRDQILFLAY